MISPSRISPSRRPWLGRAAVAALLALPTPAAAAAGEPAPATSPETPAPETPAPETPAPETPAPEPDLFGTAAAAPNRLSFRRSRGGEEHRRLQFLLGEWTVKASRFAGRDLEPGGVGGRLSVRWDLGGLLLIERWQLPGDPDAYEARRLWWWDSQASAFRVFEFDSSGLPGRVYVASLGDGTLTLERHDGEGEAEVVERTLYRLAPPAGKGPATLTVVEERGARDAPPARTFEAVLVQDGR